MLEQFERTAARRWTEPQRRRVPRCVPRAWPRDAETRLVALARAPVPLRRALARVAGRMVATSGWQRLGFARLEDYAAERAGMSARELRDLASVDRALSGLPRIDAAFQAGEIGWTQARLLCRVAKPEDEQDWLAVASQLSARALAREVRAVDRCAREANAGVALAEQDDEVRLGVIVRCTPQVRARWWHARQVANRVAGHSLSFGAFAEVLTAEVLSAVALGAEGEDAERVPGESAPRGMEATEAGPRGVAPAALESPTPFVAALERDLDEADAFELDARLCRAVRLEARHLAQVASLLEIVVAHGLHRDLGFGGLDGYAEERLAMAPSRARALLRIARAARVCLPLRDAFATGRISWVQAHALVPLLLDPEAAAHRAAWLAHAERVSVRRLRDDVESAMATGAFAPGPVSRADLQTGADTHSREENARLFFSVAAEVAHLFRATLATVQRRLEHLHRRPSSQSEALEAMLEHAVATWEGRDPRRRPPREHRVFERDGWRCTVPGCSSYRNLHGHHIVFRSACGSEDLSNLTTLCAWHHQRGVHAGIVRCRGLAPGALRFELGVRVKHAPLLAYGPGEVRMLD